MLVSVLYGSSGKWQATAKINGKEYRVGGGRARSADEAKKRIGKDFEWPGFGGGSNYEVEMPDDFVKSIARRWKMDNAEERAALGEKLHEIGVNHVYTFPADKFGEMVERA